MNVITEYLKEIQLKKVDEIAATTTASLALMSTPYILKTANFAYNKIFSKANKACSGMLASDKNMCLRKFKKNALMIKVATLRKSLSQCSKTKDPAKCKEKINQQIQSTQYKIKITNDIIRNIERNIKKTGY